MTDPAFSPITQTELIAWCVILPTLFALAYRGVLWGRRLTEEKECRANHPTSKGLPRK